MPVLNCLIQTSEDALTVGQHFAVECTGDISQIRSETPELRLDEADKYKIHFFGLKKVADDKIELDLTSYRVGNHQIKAAQLIDGESSVVLSDLNLTVASVMDPQEPVNEPFGPMGPMNLYWPWWLWLILVFVILSVIGLISVRIRQRLQKKKMLEEIEQHDSALSPEDEFHIQVRKILRFHSILSFPEQKINPSEAQAILQRLNHQWRLFVARKFLIPTSKWSDKLILKELKAEYPLCHKDLGTEIKDLFLEFERALNPSKTISTKDILQIIEISRQVVDSSTAHYKSHYQKGNKK